MRTGPPQRIVVNRGHRPCPPDPPKGTAMPFALIDGLDTTLWIGAVGTAIPAAFLLARARSGRRSAATVSPTRNGHGANGLRPGRPTSGRPHIVIAGGGYVGMYAALRLQRKLRRNEARITVIEPQPNMTYQPFLPEAAAGSLEPRHVVVSLRRTLKRCDVVTARVTAIHHRRRVVTVTPLAGSPYEIGYDIVVVALGSVARTLPIPGLAETAIGFKQIEEAIALRNRVLEQLDTASSVTNDDPRRRSLTFVVVGGGYAGVEALAELEDMARYASRYYDNIGPADMRWVLVEASDRILPEVGPDLGRYTIDQLRRRDIEVMLSTRLESCVDGHVTLSDGQEFEAGTIVWTAGVTANPVLADTDLPIDDRGRVIARTTLAVDGADGAWTAGDNAAVPDLTRPGKFCSPSAQHAVRQAKVLADNIVRTVRRRQPHGYRHKHAGSVASLGLHKGVAEIYGVKLKGFPAWFMHRTYHMSRMPTLNRKVRIIIDWTLALCFRRDVVSLGQLQSPRKEFERAARQPTAANHSQTTDEPEPVPAPGTPQPEALT
jgi:NADH:ubiquinone reductase (H+-translocating)